MARRKKQNEEQPENFNDTTNESDDTFGLPEIEYEPLKRDEPVVEEAQVVQPVQPVSEEATSYETVQETVEEEDEEQFTPNYMREETPSVMPKVLGGAVVLLLIAAAVWYFAMYQPQIKAAEEKARQAEVTRLAAAQKQEAERIAEQQRLDAERRAADSLAVAKPAEGAIETLSERSGRYYVVVASAIDDDLIMDYAKNLSKKGVSSKIIPPFGKSKFYRIAIDVADTYAAAQINADGKKGGDFGNEVWVVKY